MHWYTSSAGPKLAFVCWPGSDPASLLLNFTGQDAIGLDPNGMLQMYLAGKWFSFREASAYQFTTGNNLIPLNWGAEYQDVNGNGLVSFYTGVYDSGLPLVLQIGPLPAAAWQPADPKNMGWSTYMGGSDNDEFLGVSTDEDGNAYVCGYTESIDFPVEPGSNLFDAFDDSYGASQDMVIAKFQASNKQLAWATYHGGTGGLSFYEQAVDIDVYTGANTSLDHAFVTGSTRCVNFPLAQTGSFASALSESCPAYKTRLVVAAYTKVDGLLDWSTTHGTSSTESWDEVGTSIDVDDSGTLAVGGRLYAPFGPGTFPYVTPQGAFTKTWGGGMFILFDEDYQVKWCSPFGSMGEKTRVNDVKVIDDPTSHFGKGLYLCGSTAEPTSSNYSLDVVSNGATFYQGAYGGGGLDAYLARLDIESTYELEYCTYWGGDGVDMGNAIAAYDDKELFLVGSSTSSDLTNTELPAPIGSYSTATLNGYCDGVLLHFNPQSSWVLAWGTLYGGENDEAFFDMVYDGNRVYAVGETSSETGINTAMNPTFYTQGYHGIPLAQTLDAMIVSFEVSSRQPFWTTWFGGERLDRAWGIAIGDEEAFVVGGTWSDQALFPLLEFDDVDPLDWYDADMLNNLNPLLQYMYYPFAETYTHFHIGPTWGGYTSADVYDDFRFDGFIASFGLDYSVGVGTSSGPKDHLLILPVEWGAVWEVVVPSRDTWRLEVHDSQGRLTLSRDLGRTDGPVRLDMRTHRDGLYLVAATALNGQVLRTKLVRQ